MDAAEIKLISHEFRDLVSRTADSSHEHLQVNVCRLLDFVEDTPLLREVVEGAPRTDVPGEEVVRRSLKQGGRERIQTPREGPAELGFLHDLLVHLSRVDANRFEQFVLCYGFATQLRENIGELLEDTVLPYASHLRRVIAAAHLRATPEAGASRVDIKTSERGFAQIVAHTDMGMFTRPRWVPRTAPTWSRQQMRC